jgi:hypothetical protein
MIDDSLHTMTGWALYYKPEGRWFESRLGLIGILSIYLILTAALRPWGLLILYQKLILEMFLGIKARLAHKADSFTAICEPIV